MFTRLGRLVVRRRRTVLLAWLAAVFIGGVLSGQVMSALSAQQQGNSELESARVFEQLSEIDGAGGDVTAVVATDPGDVEHPAVVAAVTAAANDLRTMEGVANVATWYDSQGPPLLATEQDATLVVTTVDAGLSQEQTSELTEEITEHLHGLEDGPAADRLDVTVGGTLPMYEEFRTDSEEDLRRGELIALPIALVAMVFIFGGLVAAGLPLAIAVVSVTATMSAIYAATQLMDVSVFSINVVTMLGLGLGIDYGLLMVSRFREERGRGLDVASAVERTSATAGSTVAFSALTVAAALTGLFVLDDPTFTTFGLAGTSVVLISMLAATTMLPALLATRVGARIKPAAAVAVAPAADATATGRFAQLARLVARRPLVVVLAVSGLLAVMALPFAGVRFESGDARSLPDDSAARSVATTVAEDFPARGNDPLLVIAQANAEGPELQGYLDQVADFDGVADVQVQTVDPDTTLVQVVPATHGQSDATQELVQDVRELDPGFTTEVGGTAAMLVDFKSHIAERLPIAAAVMVGATLFLLFLMTGSVLIPIKAVAMNALSLGASLGALVWVFQDGHLADLLGVTPLGAVDLFTPLLVFIFAFGLSMDYEVFLLSRIKEARDAGASATEAVAIGMQRSGRIITSAALLIVIVFAGFAAGQVMTIKQLGFGLAVSVVIDATIVRCLLVPALLTLMGERAWWAPRPLRRLHERFGLQEGTEEPVSVVAETGPELVDATR